MRTVVAGALGECVHVAGVMNFLRLAEAAGWLHASERLFRTVWRGAAYKNTIVCGARSHSAESV